MAETEKHSAENDAALTDTELEQLCDAFVASSRAEFRDTDLDLPIQDAIERIVIERMRQAWRQGYGAGSSNATDGWLRPGSERTTCPYTTPVPPAGQDEWCRQETCRHRHWRSGSMPTHRRGADCPIPPEGRERGFIFRVEAACDGYASLMDSDVPDDVLDPDAYQQGARDAAEGVRSALRPIPPGETTEEPR